MLKRASGAFVRPLPLLFRLARLDQGDGRNLLAVAKFAL